MAVTAANSPKPRGSYGSPLDPDQLRYQLAIRGWTKSELATRAGIAKATVTQATQGLPITPSVADKIAKALASQPPRADLIELVARPGPPEAIPA